MGHVVIMDLDGSLALIEHRVHLALTKEWDAFNDLLEQDTPNWPVIEMTRALRFAGHQIAICTGRRERYRERTMAWLDRFIVPYDFLMMRGDADRRPDVVIKSEMADRLLHNGLDILMSVEDRYWVVEMWRARGITCLQCALGAY